MTLAYNLSSTVHHINEERTALYVFVTGGNGQLYINYFNGSAWEWDERGSPGVPLTSSPAATSYRTNQLYAFANAADGKMYVCFWNGAMWQWADQGTPAGFTINSDVGIVVHFNDNIMPLESQLLRNYLRTNGMEHLGSGII